MVQYDKRVINKLLDMYESSLLSTGENERTIHIELKFIKQNIPEYFNESSDEYEKIHVLMDELEQKGLIKIIWKGGRKGHIISKIRLNTDSPKKAYKYAGRIPKIDLEAYNYKLLKEYLDDVKTPVCRSFIMYLLDRLEQHKPVKEFILLDTYKDTKMLLDTIQAVENNDKQLYIREFSILTFQDSKAFEQIAGKVIHVFKRLKPGCENMEQSELLAEYNIYNTPNYVYLKGSAAVCIGDERIDLKLLKQGIGISGDDIDRIRFMDTQDVRKVITIENLTTYFRWHEEDSLIIYLGGYHNMVRRALLSEIYKSIPGALYCHFGDIDAGGFEIYRDLCDRTNIPFSMYRMDLTTLQAYEQYAKSLTIGDRKRLTQMKDRKELREVIDYMLENNVKLEQECVGIKG